jgi:hypothetical protein
MSDYLDYVKQTYNAINAQSLELLDAFYAPTIHFVDPLHEEHGLEGVKAYYERLYSGVAECRFEFEDALESPARIMLAWTMHLRHKSFRPQETLHLKGVSRLHHGQGRVHFHQDYFDAGAMLYERIPLLGAAVRGIKRRVAGG